MGGALQCQQLFDMSDAVAALLCFILSMQCKMSLITCLCAPLVLPCLQDIFCYENVQELGQQAGIITAERPVLCKPSKHVSTHRQQLGCCQRLMAAVESVQLLGASFNASCL
jgi:hypothetical protein